MTTGSRGLHLVVPLDGRQDFDAVRAFAQEVADHLTTAARKEDRGERLYLDVQRNGYAQTGVAPYAVRARPDAPVAVPIGWNQLDDPGTDARRWTIADAAEQARTFQQLTRLCGAAPGRQGPFMEGRLARADLRAGLDRLAAPAPVGRYRGERASLATPGGRSPRPPGRSSAADGPAAALR